MDDDIDEQKCKRIVDNVLERNHELLRKLAVSEEEDKAVRWKILDILSDKKD